MPEIPDLEGYRAYFNKRLPGLTVRGVETPIAWMVRAGREEFQERLQGHIFLPVQRCAKMLLFPFQGGDHLVVHAMLAGRYEYVAPKTRVRSTTAWILKLDKDMELRYFDERCMGRTYLVREEEFHDFKVTLVCGVRKGRGAVSVFRIDIDSLVQQGFHGGDVPFTGRAERPRRSTSLARS